MGNTNTGRGARRLLVAFGALAAAGAVGAAYYVIKPLTEKDPFAGVTLNNNLLPSATSPVGLIPLADPLMQPRGPSASDLKELDDKHKEAVANIAKRNAARCATIYDTTLQGPLGNAQMEQVLALNEVGKTRPAAVTPSKVLLVAADRAGYAVCFDSRLSKSEYVAAIHMDNKVLALNPAAQNIEKPLFAQQQALTTTLQYLHRFWMQGVPEKVAALPITIALHPGNYVSDFYINSWGANNLMPAPVKDFVLPKDPDAEKRRWMQQATLPITNHKTALTNQQGATPS